MSNIRYKAQRVGSHEWLHYDLPLTTDGPLHTFSSYETFDATVSPEMFRRLADDGHPLLWKWGTWIHVETDNERVFTGIIDDVWAEGSTLRIRVRDWIGYLHGLTFRSVLWGVKADPADLVRALVSHVDSFHPGRWPVTVVGSTPIRVGTDSDDKAAAAKVVMDTKKQAYDAAAKPRKALEAQVKKLQKPYEQPIRILNRERRTLQVAYRKLVDEKASKTQIAAAKALVDAKDAQIKAKQAEKDSKVGNKRDLIEDMRAAEEPLKDAYDAAKAVYDAAKEQAQKDGGAWKALAVDNPDCWKILKDLSAEGFEFTTETVKTNGAPILRLVILDRIPGRTRDDLIFESGVNIIEQPEVRAPDEYANEVIAMGAGEGSGDDRRVLRHDIAVTDARLRRTAIYSDPSITTESALIKAARVELARLRDEVEIPELVVRDHPNCRVGAWQAGDIITIKLLRVPFYGKVVLKRRIRSWQRVGTSKAKLFLEAP